MGQLIIMNMKECKKCGRHRAEEVADLGTGFHMLDKHGDPDYFVKKLYQCNECLKVFVDLE